MNIKLIERKQRASGQVSLYHDRDALHFTHLVRVEYETQSPIMHDFTSLARARAYYDFITGA